MAYMKPRYAQTCPFHFPFSYVMEPQERLRLERHISESYQDQILSAVKLFYTEVIDQAEKVERLLRPKRPEKIPQVLTDSEVSRLLRAVDNLKHRAILMLIYAAGLRLGEVLKIRMQDIQPEKSRWAK